MHVGKYDHITPVLHADYKALILHYKALRGPVYLSDHLHPHDPPHALRSQRSDLLKESQS